MNLRQLLHVVLQRETEKERIMRRGRTAIRGARKRSEWLGKRPLTDGSDEDNDTASQGS